ACSAVTQSYVIARTTLLFFGRCAVRDLETQHTNQLPVLGQHTNLPVARRVAREVLFVGPGAVAFLAPAVDVQGDAVDFLAVELPDVINPLVQAARRVDRGVGIESAAPDLLGADFVQAVAGRAILHLRADRHVG